MAPGQPQSEKPHVVILGGGFAGLTAAKALRRAPVSITIIDRRNHHLFQPLLYQVAMAALSPADIAAPIRGVFSRNKNVNVELAEAERIDAEHRLVALDHGETIEYDYLIVATGMTHFYFGHDDWAEHAPGLKSAAEALQIRNRFLRAFEMAERTDDEYDRQAWMTFVIVGAGPTGVELAGTMAEIARRDLPGDFRHCDTRQARIILIEAHDRVLHSMDAPLSARAKRDLEGFGVEVRLSSMVTGIDDDGVDIGDERIGAKNVIWAAGVKATSIGATIGAATDKSGRVIVEPDLSAPGHPEIFVVGDLASFTDPETDEAAPGLAPVAIQMGRHAARIIAADVKAGGSQKKRPTFHYRDRGELATIGRARAVGVVFGKHRVTGLLAWLLWLVVHIYFLIGFRNRLMVLFGWAQAYLRFERGARLITGEETDASKEGPIIRNNPREQSAESLEEIAE